MITLLGYVLCGVFGVTARSKDDQHEHLCVPIRHWLRPRWLCISCARIFREDVR
jgi:hypothetical protein